MANYFMNISLGNAKADDSQFVEQSLVATTANIVGTSYKGPAFVPQKLFAGQVVGDVQVYNTLENTLGTRRQNQHAHLYDNYACHADSMAYDAASAWLNNGGIYSSFTRVLGIGTGVIDNNTGKMQNSGFNAANDISSGSLDQRIGPNRNATLSEDVPGNVTFVAKTLNQVGSQNINYLRELGLNTDETNHFITDVVLFASGVMPSLIENPQQDETSDQNYNYLIDSVSLPLQNFQIERVNQSYFQLNGLNPKNQQATRAASREASTNYRDTDNFIQKQTDYSTSFKNYFADRFLERGHLVYATFPFSGLNSSSGTQTHTLLTTSPYSSFQEPDFPDYNSFESEFTTAKTPWVTSQPFNRESISDNRSEIHKNVENLFRFWALDDGEIGNRFRIKINPKLRGDANVTSIAKSDQYATFDIYIFEYDPRINKYTELEKYEDVNLDPDSAFYIGRKIGTVYKYYDFIADKIVEKGKYSNKSQVLRVEVDKAIEYKTIYNQHQIIPSGFRSYPHIELKKDAFRAGTANIFNNLYHLPPLYSLSYYEEYSTPLVEGINNHWGVVFNRSKITNSDKFVRYTEDAFQNEVSPHFYYTKYFLSDIDETKNVSIQDDNYLNSFFHLEKIAYFRDNFYYYHSGSSDSLEENFDYLNLNNESMWKERELNDQLKNKLSFDFFTFGGFDGVDIRDTDKRFLRNDAIARELYSGGNEIKNTFTAYDKAIDIAMDDSNCAGDIFVMPGIKEIPLVEKVIQKCEEDRRHFFICDIGGAASNRIVDFNTIDDNTEVIKSLGIMGRYYHIENVLSDYSVDESRLVAEDTRFNLDPNNDDSTSFYRYKDVLDKQHSYAISTWKGLDLRSRYVLPVFGDLYAESAVDVDTDQLEVKKQISPDTFVLGQLAQIFNPRISLIDGTVSPVLYSDVDTSFSLIDDKNLLESDLNFEIIAKDLRNAAVNVIYKPLGADNVKLYSENTSYENRKSIFQQQSIVRTIQEIKKIVKYNIFIDDTFNEGGFLFTQNNSFRSIYTRLDLQLKDLMQSFVDAGYITDYLVKIPKETDDKTILDMQNYIVRGTIILQFNESDIIKLSVDDILNDLSLLSDDAQDQVLIPEI